MTLSCLEMSRYLILNNELQRISNDNTLKNKEIIAEYVSQELKELEHKKQMDHFK